MRLLSLFKKKEKPEKVLEYVHNNRGILWEKIAEFNEQLQCIAGAVVAHSEGMDEQFPTTHHFKNGLYTREIFMPKGSLVVSFIHKQNHPSFFMSGEMSILLDTGDIKRIKAPMVVQTEVGTQRVAYIHEDTTWVCVYKTEKENVEDAMKEVYTTNFKELPEWVIEKQLSICQD
jgi:hypothetical protein|tara:strand:+ start:56 stop:577 length:522 start_codon:yes stop_codon:yes gene_type:complete